MKELKREKIVAWITTHALKSGIKEVEGEVIDFGDIEAFFYGKNGTGPPRHEWHRTKEAAVCRAKEMLLNEIDLTERKLEMRIKRLEAMKRKIALTKKQLCALRNMQF